jgi:molecular chaperone Hsp33
LSSESIEQPFEELKVKDCMRTALSADGLVSAKALVTSTLVRHITTQQGCLPLAAAALGRAMTCSLIIADGLKDKETFQVCPISSSSPSRKHATRP